MTGDDWFCAAILVGLVLVLVWVRDEWGDPPPPTARK